MKDQILQAIVRSTAAENLTIEQARQLSDAIAEGLEHLPEATHSVVIDEGDLWQPWYPHTFRSVHAIKFSDGRVWDTWNGWRAQ